MAEYTPTMEEVREAVAEWCWSRRMFRPVLEKSDGAEIDRWLTAHDAEVRADERAKIEEERRREHAEASAQRVPPIVEMADGFVGSTKIDRLGIELMRVWGRVDKTSSVSQHPLGYVATFADMARAVLDWPELADERAKRPDREQLEAAIKRGLQAYYDHKPTGGDDPTEPEHLIVEAVLSSLALEPEAREEAELFHDQDGDLWKLTDKGEWFHEEEPGEFRQVLSIDAEDQTLTPVGHAELAPDAEATDADSKSRKVLDDLREWIEENRPINCGMFNDGSRDDATTLLNIIRRADA